MRSDADTDILYDLARSLNSYVPPERSANGSGGHQLPPGVPGERAGDDFSRRASWADVLEPHGWRPIDAGGGKVYWRRPGKDGPGWSATTGYCKSELRGDLLYVFSANATPFEPERAYSKFEAFAMLNHGGNFRAAALALAGSGYGAARPAGPPQGRGEARAAAPPQPTEWEPPIPLDAPPAVAPFPLEVLPDRLRRYVEECAWATNTPHDFTAVPMLVLAGGVIGNSRRLSITRTHQQSACLFAAVVGVPGTGKSIPLEHLQEPFELQEHLYHQLWRQELSAWERDEREDRGDRPRPRRCLLDDVTTEAMVRILSENPRGVAMVRDELAALATGFNQYKEGGKGSDRQVFLKVWSGATIRVDRSKQDGIPLTVRRPFVAVIGGIQPAVIDFLRGEARGGKAPPDDGFLDRFLVTYPATPRAIGEQWREISEEAERDWAGAVGALLGLEMQRGNDGTRYPHLLALSDSGREAWAAGTSAHADEINDEGFPEWLRGPWSKLYGYAGRLALVLHCLRAAAGEAPGEEVDGQSVRAGWQLVGYFKAHARKLWASLGADPRVHDARKVLAWVARDPDRKAFSRRDVYRDLRCSFKSPESLEAPLRLLVEHRHLRPCDDEPGAGTGRRPAPRYEVNPSVTRDRSDRSDETAPRP